jgi:hypothetical protein
MPIPSEAEYLRRERALFIKQLNKVEKAPLAERREDSLQFEADLRDTPETVAERIGWILNGSYGKGSYDAAHEVIRRPRMNHGAWLLQTVGALEWRAPVKGVIAAWKKLTVAQKAKLERLIKKEIKDALTEE